MSNMSNEFNDDTRLDKGPYSQPAVSTVPTGAGTRYAKKYVRIPADVMKHVIMPAAANMAAQALQVQQIAKGERFKVYHQLLSKYLEQGINYYRKQNGLDQAEGEGVLSGVSITGKGSDQSRGMIRNPN
jgi:hypothetical protein